AAHVEESLPVPQSGLAADEIRLLFLRGAQVLAPGGEVGARAHHAPVEEEGGEIVPRVVMVANPLAIPLARLFRGPDARGSRPIAAGGRWIAPANVADPLVGPREVVRGQRPSQTEEL